MKAGVEVENGHELTVKKKEAAMEEKRDRAERRGGKSDASSWAGHGD